MYFIVKTKVFDKIIIAFLGEFSLLSKYRKVIEKMQLGLVEVGGN